jgi:hypothetical protein
MATKAAKAKKISTQQNRRPSQLRELGSGFLRFVAPLLVPQRLLGVAGLSTVAVGTLVAWKAESATPIIVIGGVLAILGFFDWSELGAEHGDWKVFARRTKNALERATETESDAELRERVEAIEGELELVETEPDPRRRLSKAWQTSWDFVLPPAPPAPQARHHMRPGGVDLELDVRATWGDIICTIQSPDGIAWTKKFFSPGIAQTAPRSFKVLFPEDFDGAKLLAGDYDVTWAQSGFLSMLNIEPLPLARDKFTIPRATRGQPARPKQAES